MCGPWCFQIVRRSFEHWPDSPRVLEVGSCNVNGSVRGECEPRAASYLGVDIQPGDGVDRIVSAENLIEEFGVNAFDVVISTEMLEHVENWPKVIYNLVSVLKVGGIIVLTTRDRGMYWHGFPGDYWRFSPQDLSNIFGQMGVVISAEKDTDDQAWGSGVIARRIRSDLNGWQAVLEDMPINGVDTPRITYRQYHSGLNWSS